MKHVKQAIVIVAMIVALALVSDAQISVPHTFTTSVPVSQLNTNLSTIADGALKRNGGNVTGNVTVDSGVTIDGVDISAALGGSGTGAFATVTTSNTGATSIDAAGGITAGTGNVGIIGTDGRIPALSTTYLASLSAANLTYGAGTLVSYIYTESTYTPTWAGGGVAIGNGSLSGYYQKIGKTMHVQIYLLGGSTTNWGGATAWTFTVPEIAATGPQYIGIAQILDSGTGFHTAAVTLASGGTTISLTPTTAATAGQYNSTNPITWATGDTISISLTFRTAN